VIYDSAPSGLVSSFCNKYCHRIHLPKYSKRVSPIRYKCWQDFGFNFRKLLYSYLQWFKTIPTGVFRCWFQFLRV